MKHISKTDASVTLRSSVAPEDDRPVLIPENVLADVDALRSSVAQEGDRHRPSE